MFPSTWSLPLRVFSFFSPIRQGDKFPLFNLGLRTLKIYQEFRTSFDINIYSYI